MNAGLKLGSTLIVNKTPCKETEGKQLWLLNLSRHPVTNIFNLVIERYESNFVQILSFCLHNLEASTFTWSVCKIKPLLSKWAGRTQPGTDPRVRDTVPSTSPRQSSLRWWSRLLGWTRSRLLPLHENITNGTFNENGWRRANSSRVN